MVTRQVKPAAHRPLDALNGALLETLPWGGALVVHALVVQAGWSSSLARGLPAAPTKRVRHADAEGRAIVAVMWAQGATQTLAANARLAWRVAYVGISKRMWGRFAG